MEQQTKDSLTQLFENWAGEPVVKIEPLPPAGSDRRYYRMIGANKAAVGAFSPNDEENHTFLKFTNHFYKKGIAVPALYGEDVKNHTYLLQDLGDISLFKYLATNRKDGAFPEALIPVYKQVVEDLAELQIKGHEGLNYKKWCYQINKFDKAAMLWDLNYFKYYFLKVSNIPFDEALLQRDYNRLTRFLNKADNDYFMFRDFQARNIMLVEGKPHYIDYQGGRKGARQYDLASLLCQAKANIPYEVRDQLLEYYMDAAGNLGKFDRKAFEKYYYPFVLIRCIQVLGAYGFRGIYERKTHFLTSIPFAIRNIEWVLGKIDIKELKIPYLRETLERLVASRDWSLLLPQEQKDKKLTVTISSFSYRRGIPVDTSGHGGGFVFDCRALHNPGRFAPYKRLTGRDIEVQDFLKANSRIETYLEDVYDLVDASVEKYMKRSFSNLMVNFGCTGGQHRSVYCADSLTKHLKEKYDIHVVTNHVEQELKNWKN